MATNPLQMFSGNATHALAEKIAAAYGVELGKVNISRFADGEIQPSYAESIRGNDVFLIQSTNTPAENLLELLLMMDAARRSSVASLTVVIPYFGYARQDRKDKPRVSIGSKLIANILTAAGATRVVTMDLHAGQIQGFFDIPLDNLEATAVFVPYLQQQNIPNLCIASPDMGGVARARTYAKHLKADLVVIDKHRERANQIASMQLIGDVKDKHVVIVDDIIDTGGSLTKAAEYILRQGAASVRAAATHAVLSGEAYEKLESSQLTEILVTDSLPLRHPCSKIQVLSVATLFASALRKIYQFESVSSLFLS